MKQILFFLIVLCSCSSIMAQTSDDMLFEQAEEYYLSEQYEKALPIFNQLAERGNSYALNNLGIMHYNAQGVPLDKGLGVHYWEKAVELGNSFAMVNLGGHYFNKFWDASKSEKQAENDLYRARGLFTQAAKNGYGYAFYKLADLVKYSYWYNDLVEFYADDALMMTYLKKSSELDDNNQKSMVFAVQGKMAFALELMAKEDRNIDQVIELLTDAKLKGGNNCDCFWAACDVFGVTVNHLLALAKFLKKQNKCYILKSVNESNEYGIVGKKDAVEVLLQYDSGEKKLFDDGFSYNIYLEGIFKLDINGNIICSSEMKVADVWDATYDMESGNWIFQDKRIDLNGNKPRVMDP